MVQVIYHTTHEAMLGRFHHIVVHYLRRKKTRKREKFFIIINAWKESFYKSYKHTQAAMLRVVYNNNNACTRQNLLSWQP